MRAFWQKFLNSLRKELDSPVFKMLRGRIRVNFWILYVSFIKYLRDWSIFLSDFSAVSKSLSRFPFLVRRALKWIMIKLLTVVVFWVLAVVMSVRWVRRHFRGAINELPSFFFSIVEFLKEVSFVAFFSTKSVFKKFYDALFCWPHFHPEIYGKVPFWWTWLTSVVVWATCTVYFIDTVRTVYIFCHIVWPWIDLIIVVIRSLF